MDVVVQVRDVVANKHPAAVVGKGFSSESPSRNFSQRKGRDMMNST